MMNRYPNTANPYLLHFLPCHLVSLLSSDKLTVIICLHFFTVIDDLKVSVMKIEGKGHTIDIESKVWMHRMMRMKDSDELSVDSGFGGSVVSSRRSSFSEGVPSDAPTRDDEEALKFAADLTANRTAPSRE